MDRWNAIVKRHGIDFEFRLSHRGFHRKIGSFAEACVSPDGRIVTEAEWDAKRDEWLPTQQDAAFVGSLMEPVIAPGQFAGWIAPPPRGINGQPIDFEYVRLQPTDASA